MRRVCVWLLAGLIGLWTGVAAAAEPVVRIGALKFGTANWELEIIRLHALDRANGIEFQVTELASPQATQVALQAGAVDVIVADWLWVARQRAGGADLTAAPYSYAVGGLMAPLHGEVKGLADLPGRRLGIAGGPLDKSWLLLRALAAHRGDDLEELVEPVFGAPPLLNELAAKGDLDAVLTFWHFAARLETRGFREVLSMAQVATDLGLDRPVALLGYAFHDAWAAKHPMAVAGFLAATRAAKKILATDDSAWVALAPLLRAPDAATAQLLRDRYRQGIPTEWTAADEASADRLFTILARIGGPELVGEATRLTPGTFWPGARFQ